MIVTIHQPEHLPWSGFFNKMAYCDLFVYLDNTQFKKHYFENRNKIKRGEDWLWTTVPVKKQSLKTEIRDIEISEIDWTGSYLDQIKDGYRKAEHFSSFFPRLEETVLLGRQRLVDLNIDLINLFRDYLNIKTETIFASDLNLHQVKGSDLILKICQKTNATQYISGPDGRNYLNLDTFNDIEVLYHNYQHPVYAQLGSNFISHMSIVDLIFNQGQKSEEIIKKEKYFNR